METKTIRFEKGKSYSLSALAILPDNLLAEYYQQLMEYSVKTGRYTALKTFDFTVQINIIEDEENTKI